MEIPIYVAIGRIAATEKSDGRLRSRCDADQLLEVDTVRTVIKSRRRPVVAYREIKSNRASGRECSEAAHRTIEGRARAASALEQCDLRG